MTKGLNTILFKIKCYWNCCKKFSTKDKQKRKTCQIYSNILQPLRKCHNKKINRKKAWNKESLTCLDKYKFEKLKTYKKLTIMAHKFKLEKHEVKIFHHI